jgi:hypothetical protein
MRGGAAPPSIRRNTDPPIRRGSRAAAATGQRKRDGVRCTNRAAHGK